MPKPERRLPAPVPEVLTTAEAAAILRVSESTILRAVNQGLLPAFTLARRRLIPRDVLLARAFRQVPAVGAETGAGNSAAEMGEPGATAGAETGA
jgi:excisionase family DNA binding protein